MVHFKRFIHLIREACGDPATLRELLELNPMISVPLEESSKSIDLRKIVRWHDWGDAPTERRVIGWRFDGYDYRSFYLEDEYFRGFGSSQVTEGWMCDIQDVVGLAHSKTELSEYHSLDSMVEAKSPEMITPISHEKLNTNLGWPEVRIMRDKSSDYFIRYEWDGRLFLVNSGGSHHFAAARYVASRLGVRVPLKAKLYSYSINQMAVQKIRRDFEVFAISHQSKIFLEFQDAMRNYRVTYFWRRLPMPHHDQDAVLLPRAESRSMKVAAILKAAGAFDLGIYLQKLATKS